MNGLHVFDRGWVEMHGFARTSWVRLGAGADAVPGTLVIFVFPAPDWVPGDHIVIASSDRDYRHAEEVVISAINPVPGGGAQITLTQPVAFFHCGQVRAIVGNFSPPRSIDERAEVGLLTHSVKIAGVPRTSSGAPGYGGHIMIEDSGYPVVPPRGPTGVDGGFGRFSGVELDNMGRKGQLGRYPIHWHTLMAQGRGQFMKNSSIHHSNNRVVAVHLTDNVRFEGNVGYLHPGHGVFIEDGGEENNEFIGNLVIGTRVPDVNFALLGSDSNNMLASRPGNPNPLNPNPSKDLFQNRSPASFWITNPNNKFQGNVAAGSEGVGYWFALPSARMGLTSFFEDPAHQNPNVFIYMQNRSVPYREVLGSFMDNVCHSSWMGFDVNDGVFLTGQYATDIQKNVTWQPTASGVRQIQTLTGFVAYATNMALYTGNGDKNLRFERAVLADNTWNVAMASHDTLADSAIIRDAGSTLLQFPSTATPNSTPAYPDPGPPTAIILYDGASSLTDVNTFGYDDANGPAYGVTTFYEVGAARRRTNMPFTGIRCFASLTATSQSWSWLGGMQDASQNGGVIPPGTNLAGDGPLNPRQWGVAIDNSDYSMITLVASQGDPVAYSTIVSNHPMMLTGGEYAIPATGNPPRVYSSPFRFGYLRTFVADPSNFPTRNGELRYTRDLVLNSTTTISWEDFWQIDPYHQMAVIADRAGEDNHYRYKLDWTANGSPSTPSTPATPPSQTDIQLSGLSVGDSVLIGLLRYASTSLAYQLATGFHPIYGNPLFGNPPTSVPAGTVAQVGPGVGATTAIVDTQGTLWIRIKIVDGRLANGNGDGLGEAIRVTR